MDYKAIYTILEKYWNGETTPEEEKILKDFFSSNEVPAEWAPYKNWFTETCQEIPVLDEHFDKKILAHIPEETKPEINHKKFRYNRYIQAAAIFLALLACSFIIYEYNQQKNNSTGLALLEDTYDNPEEALAVVRNTLNFISGEINKGFGIAAEEFQKAEPALTIIKTE